MYLSNTHAGGEFYKPVFVFTFLKYKLLKISRGTFCSFCTLFFSVSRVITNATNLRVCYLKELLAANSMKLTKL